MNTFRKIVTVVTVLFAVNFAAAKDVQIKFDAEKVRSWISKGAQPSDTVKRLLNKRDFKLSV